MTVPVIVLLVLAFAAVGGSSGGPDSTTNPTSGALPPVTASAPPHAEVQAVACNKVLQQLPVTLGKLAPRIVHTKPDTPYVVAWGDPAVVLRCGVDRPKDLVPGSSARYFDAGNVSGPYFDITGGSKGYVWTTVDRGPYISISVPAKYQGNEVVPPLAQAIGAALPAVCTTNDAVPDPSKLCTRRTS